MSSGYIGHYGDYEHADRRLSLLPARLLFIYAIAEHCPQVFESLHGEPLEKYRKTGLLSMLGIHRAHFWLHCIGCLDSNYYLDGVYRYKGHEHLVQHLGLPNVGGTIEHLKNSPPWNYYSESNLSPDEYEQRRKERLPSLIDWWECLQNWAVSHNLNAGWMLHFAFLKIDSFAEGNKGRDAMYTYRCFFSTDYFGFEIQPKLVEAGGLYQYAGGENTVFEPFSFTYHGWRPTVTDEAMYREYVLSVCKRQLDDYVKRAKENFLNNLGMQKIPDRRSPEHYAWLAQYQCGEKSMSEIAKAVNKSEDGVRSGIHAAANFIGLELRKPKRGRKKGSKDTITLRTIARR